MDWQILCMLKSINFDTTEFNQFCFKEQRTCILSTYLALFRYRRDVASSWLRQQVSCHSIHDAHHHFARLSIACQVVCRGCVSQGVEVFYRVLHTLWSIIWWMFFMLYSLTLYRILTLFLYHKSKCAKTPWQIILLLYCAGTSFSVSSVCKIFFLQGTQIHFISTIFFLSTCQIICFLAWQTLTRSIFPHFKCRSLSGMSVASPVITGAITLLISMLLYGLAVCGSAIKGRCRSLSAMSVTSPVITGAITLLMSMLLYCSAVRGSAIKGGCRSLLGMSVASPVVTGAIMLLMSVLLYGSAVHGSAIKGGCHSLWGMSVASPVVTGAITLLMSAVLLHKDVINPLSMKQSLMASVRRIPGINMFCNTHYAYLSEPKYNSSAVVLYLFLMYLYLLLLKCFQTPEHMVPAHSLQMNMYFHGSTNINIFMTNNTYLLPM